MCKCIYCNSEDLSVSDIISYGLTGAKLTEKFVCYKHNAFTNDNFEKTAISNLDFFRSSLGLSERKGADIKFKANVIIDGITVPNISVSGRKSIYDDKKRLFQTEDNGKKVLVGNIEKLKQKKGVKEEDIKPLDMSDVVVSVSYSLETLLASNEMLLTIAKIAYEWHCAVNAINEYIPEKYKEIVDVILKKQPINDVVEIVVDGNLDVALKEHCNYGSHCLFEYIDINGWKYVIYCFWGVVFYKIKIYNTGVSNTSCYNTYQLYQYHLDGEKNKILFGTVGQSNFISLPAKEAIKNFYKHFNRKLEQLTQTTILSLRKTKQLADDLQDALKVYDNTAHDFAKLVDYEDDSRIMIIKILLHMYDRQEQYDFSLSYNENLRRLFEVDDTITFDVADNKEYTKHLLDFHNDETLSSKLHDALTFFEKVFLAQEK